MSDDNIYFKKGGIFKNGPPRALGQDIYLRVLIIISSQKKN